MKTLTIRQPYAWAVIEGIKHCENRLRPINHKGWLGIHAGAAWSKDGACDARILRALDRWLYPSEREAREVDPALHPDLFHFGAVLGQAWASGSHQAHSYFCQGYDCVPWGDPEWADGRPVHHLMLREATKRLEPVPAKGRLGLWEWTVAAGVGGAS